MSSSELELLLNVLNERAIPLRRDDVGWAFESSQTSDDVKHWVRELLSPATLLTREELAFHGVHQKDQNHADSVGSIISDEEFEAAISSLEASTASIEKQSRLLEAQKRALQGLRGDNATEKPVESIENHRSGKLSRDTAQLELECAELVDEIQTQLEASLRDTGDTTESIQLNVERVLEKDDRLLDGLERTLPQLSFPINGTSSAEEVERLCHALSTHSSQAIRSHVDAAYISAAETTDSQPNGLHEDEDLQAAFKQSATLRAELEELCREIDGLSTMTVDNQYRIPISKVVDGAKIEADAERATRSEYMSALLKYLSNRLDTLSDHISHVRTHSAAVRAVSHTLENVVAASSNHQKASKTSNRSPVKTSQKGLKPLRLVQANLSESSDPTTQLLRQLDVRIPDSLEPAKFEEAVNAAVRDQHKRLSLLSKSTERAISDQVTRSICQSDAQLHALTAAVFSNSAFGRTNLVDDTLTESIDQLEEDTQSIGIGMRQLEVDGAAKTMRGKLQALLERVDS